MQNQQKFLKADNNIVINEASIRWVKKMNECLEVCSKQDGCLAGGNTHKVCKENSPISYNKLNKYFDE